MGIKLPVSLIFFIQTQEFMKNQIVPNAKDRMAMTEIVDDIPTRVLITGTRRYVKVRGIKPYTIERLTRLWQQRELYKLEDTAENTLKSMCIEPYFTIKEAVLMVLNRAWKIKFLYPIVWRIWAYIREYTESQVSPIIMEGKKKLPLMPHWTNMAFSLDMRNDWKKMTRKEAEQYRAELLLVAKQVSSKSSQVTEGTSGE